MTTNEQIKEVIARADAAINAEDFDALMKFYAEGATMVLTPGKLVTGFEGLRKSFVAIAEYFNHTLHVSQEAMKVIEGADTALAIARTRVKATMKNGDAYDVVRKATYVFRRDGAGDWACVVDNSYGTDLLA